MATCFNSSKPIDEVSILFLLISTQRMIGSREISSFQIRFYNRHCNLDNHHCTVIPAGSQTLLMLIQGDVLLTFDIEGRVSLYELSILTSNSCKLILNSFVLCAIVTVLWLFSF